MVVVLVSCRRTFGHEYLDAHLWGYCSSRFCMRCSANWDDPGFMFFPCAPSWELSMEHVVETIVAADTAATTLVVLVDEWENPDRRPVHKINTETGLDAVSSRTLLEVWVPPGNGIDLTVVPPAPARGPPHGRAVGLQCRAMSIPPGTQIGPDGKRHPIGAPAGQAPRTLSPSPRTVEVEPVALSEPPEGAPPPEDVESFDDPPENPTRETVGGYDVNDVPTVAAEAVKFIDDADDAEDERARAAVVLEVELSHTEKQQRKSVVDRAKAALGPKDAPAPEDASA